MADVLFWAMISAFITHELDAVKRHEWRVLPLTSFLPERVGEQVFIWMHVPLLLILLWFSREGANTTFAQVFSSFAIFHVLLHWLFRKHPAYEFNNFSSWAIIVLTGVLGAAHLIATI
jgi:hypothetical protein